MLIRVEAETRSREPSDVIDGLTRLGRRGGLIAIIAGLAFSFFAFGYFVVYWRNADMDFMIIYNALLLNDGKPQQYFDHPAYFTILSVSYWFRALHEIGLLDGFALSAMPSASDLPAFDAAMTQAVRAGRMVAWVTGTVLVLCYAGLIRRVIDDWRVALLASFAFAFSGGVAVQLRILRSEMVAASLVHFALLILIIAGRRASAWRPLLVGCSACLCVLGLENKVHVILMIAALPILALPFGTEASSSAAVWRTRTAWLATVFAVASAASMLWAAWPILAAGLDPRNADAAGLHPLVKFYGVYQAGLMAWIGLGMLAFAARWRVSANETVASMAAVIAGAALGLIALTLRFNVDNAVAVVNPIERMLTFSTMSSSELASWRSTLAVAAADFLDLLRRYSFFLHTSARPAVFLIWLIWPGIVYALLNHKTPAAVQALLLMLTATAIDVLGVQRGLKPEYFVLTDPFIILAGALLLQALDLRPRHRRAAATGAALFICHILISQAEPVKHVMKRSGPGYICDWNQVYLAQLPVPWCDQPPRR
jgi:hypothetical protein